MDMTISSQGRPRPPDGPKEDRLHQSNQVGSALSADGMRPGALAQTVDRPYRSVNVEIETLSE